MGEISTGISARLLLDRVEVAAWATAVSEVTAGSRCRDPIGAPNLPVSASRAVAAAVRQGVEPPPPPLYGHFGGSRPHRLIVGTAFAGSPPASETGHRVRPGVTRRSAAARNADELRRDGGTAVLRQGRIDPGARVTRRTAAARTADGVRWGGHPAVLPQGRIDRGHVEAIRCAWRGRDRSRRLGHCRDSRIPVGEKEFRAGHTRYRRRIRRRSVRCHRSSDGARPRLRSRGGIPIRHAWSGIPARRRRARPRGSHWR